MKVLLVQQLTKLSTMCEPCRPGPETGIAVTAAIPERHLSALRCGCALRRPVGWPTARLLRHTTLIVTALLPTKGDDGQVPPSLNRTV
jgi:hypothetical protein